MNRVRSLFADPAFPIWAWSRALIWIVALVVVEKFGSRADFEAQPSGDPKLHDFGVVIDVWARWDSAYFLRIAEHGYASAEGAAAFYPLYPGLVGLLGRVLGGHYVLAGVLISLSATLAAFYLLWRLGASLVDPDTSRRAILYLAIFPMALFLQAVYSEALFLLVSVAAFLLAQRGRYFWAAGAAGLAVLTRPAGFALLPALFLLTWQRGERRSALLATIPPISMFSLFPLALWVNIREPFAFLTSQELWQREVSAFGPLAGLWNALRAAAAGVAQIVAGSNTRIFWSKPGILDLDPTSVAVQNLELFAYLALFLALTVVAWRRVGPPYGLYCALSLAIPLSAGREAWPLHSLPRFGLVIFPLFLALALVGRRRTIHEVIVAVSAILLGVSVVQWALYDWVS